MHNLYVSCFAEKLREYRKMKGYSQAKLAELIGFSRTAVGDWETTTKEPSYDTLLKISKVLDVTPNDLLGVDY